jgi:hypothetical protein
MPVPARPNASVCGHSIAGIAGSNPAGDMDVCVLWVLCVVRKVSEKGRSLFQRGPTESVCACVCECVCVVECDQMQQQPSIPTMSR